MPTRPAGVRPQQSTSPPPHTTWPPQHTMQGLTADLASLLSSPEAAAVQAAVPHRDVPTVRRYRALVQRAQLAPALKLVRKADEKHRSVIMAHCATLTLHAAQPHRCQPQVSQQVRSLFGDWYRAAIEAQCAEAPEAPEAQAEPPAPAQANQEVSCDAAATAHQSLALSEVSSSAMSLSGISTFSDASAAWQTQPCQVAEAQSEEDADDWVMVGSER